MKYAVDLLYPSAANAYLALKLRALQEEPDLFAMSYDEYVGTSREEAAKQLETTFDSFVVGAVSETQQLIGVVEFHRRGLRKLRQLALISALYVAPEARKQGIGRALMSKAICIAKQFGAEGLVLVVAAHDEPAIALYRSFGFTTYGMEPFSLKLKDRYVTGEQMILMLDR